MSYLKDKFGLQGKKALVTGASRGIGQAIAVALAHAGADVAITSSKSEEALVETKQRINETGRKCVTLVYDIGDLQQAVKGVDDAAAALGGLDIVVNNAGCAWPQDILTVTPESLQRMTDINMNAAFFTAQRGAQLMLENGGGSIINICSISAIRAIDRSPEYSITKAALQMITRSMAVQLANKGVRVNAIAPGWVESDLTKPLMESPGWLTSTEEKVPAKRLGRPDEIAGVAVFLASAAASFMHGETVVVDGGLTAKVA